MAEEDRSSGASENGECGDTCERASRTPDLSNVFEYNNANIILSSVHWLSDGRVCFRHWSPLLS
jgi:hypothetical protein